jgi:hypothetical protein
MLRHVAPVWGGTLHLHHKAAIVCRLLVTASVVPGSLILVTLMVEALSSS